jgi:hypothetical protein
MLCIMLVLGLGVYSALGRHVPFLCLDLEIKVVYEEVVFQLVIIFTFLFQTKSFSLFNNYIKDDW